MLYINVCACAYCRARQRSAFTLVPAARARACRACTHVCVRRARVGGAGLFCGYERAFIDCVLTEGA